MHVIKPCPSCDSEQYIIKRKEVTQRSWGATITKTLHMVKCMDCGYHFHRWSETEEYAVKGWNQSPLRDETKLQGRCPLCLQQKAIVKKKYNYTEGWRIRCKGCGLSSGKYKTKEEAILAWVNIPILD